MTDRSPLAESLAELGPIEGRRTLAAEIADRLRDLILLERLAPGAPIRERDLAEALGISRTPLREALRILEMDELVTYSATRRPMVADPDVTTLAQNLRVLGALEALAGEEACAQATDAELAALAAAAREMAERSDSDEPLAFFRRDMAFHRGIVEAARNPPLLRAHAQFNARLWRARFISSRRRLKRARTLEEHLDIAAALSARDAAASAAALRTHLGTAADNVAAARHDPGED